MHTSQSIPRHAAVTLIELLVGLSIIIVLVGLLLPALSKARQSAQATICAGGLRQWGMALRLYLNDHDQFLPREAGRGNGAEETNIDPDAWFNALPAYVNARSYGSHYDGSNLTNSN